MADRWYYTSQWRPKGPAVYEQLKQLALSGDLAPTDLVWPEGGDPRRAIEARSVLNFAALRPAKGPSGEWLGKVAQALDNNPAATTKKPDWLADLQEEPSKPAASEEEILEVLSIEEPTAANTPTVNVVPVQMTVPLGTRYVPYPPRLAVGGASSPGRVRDRNEDRYQTLHYNWNDAGGMHEVAIIVVADGMGGYDAGDVASSLTVRTVLNHLAPIVTAAVSGKAVDGATLAAAVDQSLREANRVILQQATTQVQCKGMGATAAVVAVWDGHAYFSHIGDCRVYLHHERELKQLTEDQTLVARMVAMGKLTAEEAANHESRNEVTQAVGKRSTLEPSRGDHALECGDSLLIACDGLAAHVDGPTIEQALNAPAVPAQHLPSQLVSMADEGGGTDNCTVVLAHFA